jgi:hypothetical protein
VERTGIAVEEEGKEKAITGPESQKGIGVGDAVAIDPNEFAFGVGLKGSAFVAVDEENEGKPVLAFASKSGPGKGGSEADISGGDSGFFKKFAAGAGEGVFGGFHFAA